MTTPQTPSTQMPNAADHRSGRTPRSAKGKGPGVLEALVALGILISLSGVLMPAVGEQVGQARVDHAYADMLEIARGMAQYSRDTLFLPTGVQGRTNVAWLYGPGEIPAGNSFGKGGEGRALDDVLQNASMGGAAWAGPYSAPLTPDPWGHAYLVNADGWISARERAVVLCAGPDGAVQTGPEDRTASGDDLLYVMD